MCNASLKWTEPQCHSRNLAHSSLISFMSFVCSILLLLAEHFVWDCRLVCAWDERIINGFSEAQVWWIGKARRCLHVDLSWVRKCMRVYRTLTWGPLCLSLGIVAVFGRHRETDHSEWALLGRSKMVFQVALQLQRPQWTSVLTGECADFNDGNFPKSYSRIEILSGFWFWRLVVSSCEGCV